MMKTMPTRINGDLFEAAKVAGELHSRSAAQQVDHWARIGRELEASPTVTHGVITNVLAGVEPYDALPEREQAIVRATWNERITETISGLDFTDRLQKSGRVWAEADADGNVVRGPLE